MVLVLIFLAFVILGMAMGSRLHECNRSRWGAMSWVAVDVVGLLAGHITKSLDAFLNWLANMRLNTFDMACPSDQSAVRH